MKRIRVEEIDGVIFIDGVDIIKTIGEISKEADRLKIENQKQKEIISKTIKHVSSLSSKGRSCEIYANVKKDILDILNGVSE